MVLGWIFLYQGFVAFMDPTWSILPAIENAQTFPTFYSSLVQAPMIGFVTFAVKALYVVVGLLLLIGIATRLASLFGFLLMLFLYFPLLNFPYIKGGGYVVDYHIVYALILLYFLFARGHAHTGGIRSLFKSSR
jgi:uncharacterized membrane protein YphA (DoxX/SURF4 family)